MPLYKLDFYEEPLRVVEGLVNAAKRKRRVILTLYSPFMCAAHTTSVPMITGHIQENPEAVKRGMEIITESLMQFVKAAIRRDGWVLHLYPGRRERALRRPGAVHEARAHTIWQ